MNRLIIDACGITKFYGAGRSRVTALAGVDLSIEYGEILALNGPSGSGKSTLLNILGCLDTPSDGRYALGGREVSFLNREAQAWVRLHYVGFVFQSFHLIAHASALENVALPLYYCELGRREREQRSLALLERVGLLERARHRPRELSGGERQRIAIARAIAVKPKLLLADEPTGALDTQNGREILKLLAELRASEGITIVMVTHDPTVSAFADRRIGLRDGRIFPQEARP